MAEKKFLRKKIETSKDTPAQTETLHILRLSFLGEILEISPTSEYPFQLLETQEYEDWIDSTVDIKTNTRITNSVGKMRRGLFGDWKEADGIFEMRLDFGPGYRIYYVKVEKIVVLLLGGGDKGSQQRDIASAQILWKRLRNEITKI